MSKTKKDEIDPTLPSKLRAKEVLKGLFVVDDRAVSRLNDYFRRSVIQGPKRIRPQALKPIGPDLGFGVEDENRCLDQFSSQLKGRNSK